MPSIMTEIAGILSKVHRHGDFFAFGKTEILAPRLEVAGVGPVALPLLPAQAEQLIAVADRAPHGRGADTLVDVDVRRTWQIHADRVKIGGKHWPRTLEAILARVAEGLGVSEPIAAEFYKLLIYDKGSFFVSHRDTEKTGGMFATLVVVLPSISTGGELIVRHEGREVSLDMRCEEPCEAAFAAFYADCVHEVLPVTSGFRLTLVYNLLRKGKGRRPEPPGYDSERDRAAALLKKWAAGKRSADDNAPEKLIYPLDHAYTPAELGFETLKGADAAKANLLAAAALQAGCDLHLALLSIEESGIAEYAADFNPRRGRWSDEEEFEAGEVCDRHEHLSEWRRPDGSASTLGPLPIEDKEICPPDALKDMVPDEEHFHEATGNEGASFERTYRRAALVLWPRERIYAVLNQAGLSVTLPYLQDLIERWETSDKDAKSVLSHQATELAGHMLSTWPRSTWRSTDNDGPSEAARMLALLTRLGAADHIDAFVTAIIAGGHHGKSDNEAILGALRLFSPERAAALLKRIVDANAATSLGACGNLLAQATIAFPNDLTSLHGVAAALVAQLPGDPSKERPPDPWRRDAGVQPGFVVDLFAAVEAIDETLAERAAQHILAWPKTYGLDTVLVPALRTLADAGKIKSQTAIRHLRMACIEHLRARASEPLEAPGDWRRESELTCRCAQCGELGRFLADPTRERWILKAAEAVRGHVEETIRKARCDVDVMTDRRGRPYSLICNKNQASYDRRVKQRNQDLADLALLGAE